MSDPIASLTDEQATHAIKLFYDFAPSEVWEDEEKPSPERVKTIAAALAKQAPADLQPAVASLMADGQPSHTAVRAEVCRLILRQLRQSPKFQPFADRAIETASQPHMAIDPVTGAFIVVMLLATTKVTHTPEGWSVQVAGGAIDAIRDLPKLLHELPSVLKALPVSVWNAITKLKGA